PFGLVAVGLRKQPAHHAVALAVAREQREGRRIAGENDLRPYDELESRQALGTEVRFGCAVDAVAVGDREGVQTQFMRPRDQLVGMGGSLEKGEVRSAAQLRVPPGRIRFPLQESPRTPSSLQ